MKEIQVCNISGLFKFRKAKICAYRAALCFLYKLLQIIINNIIII